MPPYAISFVGTKGGLGKSTLAIAVGCEWAARGLRVLLLDLDEEQFSLSEWEAIRRALEVTEGPDVIELHKPLEALSPAAATREFQRLYRKSTTGYDLVILDTPGRAGERAVMALGVSDLCIMPTSPNPIEVRRLPSTIRQVTAVTRVRKELDAVFLLTRLDKRTSAARTAHKIFETSSGFDLLETELQAYADYAKSFGAGYGVTTFDASSRAAGQVRQLVDELERRLGMRAPAVADRSR
jgi:chromosome partitioning protein